MKKRFFQLLSAMLAVCLLLTAAPLSGFVGVDLFPKAKAYAVGDHIQYGNYPQSRVSDSALISNLDAAPKTWKSYRYYSGTGSDDDGKMVPSDYMQFADFFYGGNKYRAVTFSAYRPYATGYTQSASNSYQDENGYEPNRIYYFLYEPIDWRILDPADGLILSEMILDSQAYQNTIYYANSKAWQDTSASTYASDYATSSIRDWLNNDFYETAFTDAQKSNIRNDVWLNNDSSWRSAYNSVSTKDKIFLLSLDESKNSSYGFSSSASDCNVSRHARGTDYAQCQGLYVYHSSGSIYDGFSWWWLRSPIDSLGACNVHDFDYSNYDVIVRNAGSGVRAACRLANLQSDISQSQNLFSESAGSVTTTVATITKPQMNAPGKLFCQYVSFLPRRAEWLRVEGEYNVFAASGDGAGHIELSGVSAESSVGGEFIKTDGVLEADALTAERDAVINGDVTLTKDGFQKYIIPSAVLKSFNCLSQKDYTYTHRVFMMQDKKDGKPYISSVYGRLSGNGEYVSLISDGIKLTKDADTGKCTTADLAISVVGMDNAAFRIVLSDGTRIYEGNSLILSSLNLYDKLKENQSVYLYAINQKGETTEPVKIGLGKEPYVDAAANSLIKQLANGEWSIFGKDGLKVTLPDSIPGIGGMELQLAAGAIPVGCTRTSDGKYKVSIGLDIFDSTEKISTETNKNGSQKTESSFSTKTPWNTKETKFTSESNGNLEIDNDAKKNSVFDYFKSQCEQNLFSVKDKNNPDKYSSKSTAKKIKEMREKFGKGNVKSATDKSKAFSVDFLGYAEFYIKNGKPVFTAMQACVSAAFKVKIKGQHTWFYYYIEFGAEDMGGTVSGARAVADTDIPLRFDFTLTASPMVGGGGGVGWDDLLSAGLWAEAKAPISWSWTNNHVTLDLEGSLGAEMSLWIFKPRVTLLSGSVNLIDFYYGNKNASKKAAAKTDTGATEDEIEITYAIDDRSYLPYRSAWLSGEDAAMRKSPARTSPRGISFTNLQTNVGAFCQPQMVKVGDKLLAVFVTDDETRDTYNRMKLVYTVFDPSSAVWSAPAAINDTGCNDGYPVLVSNGNEAWVAWYKTAVLNEDTDVEAMLSSIDVYAARFNGIGFDPAVRITNNDTYETALAMQIVNDQPVICFASESLENGVSDLIRYSNGALSTLARDVGSVSSVSIKNNNEITYISTSDGCVTLNGANADTVMMEGQTVPTYAQYQNIAGETVLVYGNGMNLCYKTGNTLTYIFDTAETVDDGNLRFLYDGNATDLIYTVTNDEKEATLYWTELNGDTWQTPVQIGSNGTALSSLCMEKLNGRLYGVGSADNYTKSENGMEYASSDLCAFAFTDTVDLSLTEVIVDEINMTPGETGNILVYLENLGTTDVFNASFTVSDTLGTEYSVEKTLELFSGDNGYFELEYPVPENYTAGTLTVTVNTANDGNSENNCAEAKIGAADLRILRQGLETIDGVYCLSASALNLSAVPAEKVTASLYVNYDENAEDAAPDRIIEIGTLNAENYADLDVYFKTADLNFNDDGYALVALKLSFECEDAFVFDNVLIETLIEQEEMLTHTEHSWNAGEVTTPATCKDKGKMLYTCTVCGATTESEIPTDPDAHEFSEQVYAPACTAGGYTEHICLLCGYSFTDNQTDPIGHKWGAWTKLSDSQHQRICANDASHVEAEDHVWNDGEITKPATPTQEGEKTFTCTVCNATYTEPIEKLPEVHTHDAGEWVILTAATCLTAGTRELRCTGCGEVLKTETIPATGHTWGNWTKLNEIQHQRICSNDASHVETGAHVWNDGEITKPATPTQEGEKTFTCTVCGATRTEKVDRLPGAELIDTDTAKEIGANVYLIPEQTAAALVALAGEGAKLEKADGSAVNGNEIVGSGMTLTKADGTKLTLIIKGDNDGDGMITAADARYALRVAVSLETPNDWQLNASIVTGGDKVTAADARAILRAAVGLEDLKLT